MTGLAEPAAATEVADLVERAVTELLPVVNALERSDLADRLTAAVARLKRPSTVVCVVGEFKQGKSSLVNGLLGTAVCPVDDDLATSAITLVRYGDEAQAVVRRRDGDKAVAEQVPVAEVGRWVSEAGNPSNSKRVERVDIAVPSAILRQGLALVDTPGMGGLGAGHAAATLAFLPFADGLIFVSDASAELSAPEVDFLQQASELCPTVLSVETKVDLYESWRRILELNRGHLAGRGVSLPMVSVSSTLRAEALARKDRDLNDRSGFPGLIEALSDQVIGPAKANAAARSASDARRVLELVRSSIDAQLELLADPSRLEETMRVLEAAKARLEHLKGPGARWSLVVGDRVADLSNEITHRFRSQLRTVNRGFDEKIEKLSTPEEWDALTRELQTAMADAVTAAFVAVEAGRAQIREEVLELLDEENLQLPAVQSISSSIDVRELWETKPIEPSKRTAGKAFTTGITGVRGAQSGVMMFGMMGQFLPTAAGALFASNPVLLGVGAIFGGLQLFEDRKRKVAGRRQAARMQLRQFIDDVQFEVGNEMGNVVRTVQRDLRDEFSQRLTELQRTYTDTGRQAQENAQRDQAETTARTKELSKMAEALTRVEQALGAATPAAT